jgi:type IV secretory pathway VirB4 component
MMLQRLLQGRTVLSIDPEGENNTLCEAVGGKVVPASIPADKDTCLLHPLQADTPSDMLLAVRFIMTILAGEAAMTPSVHAVLHEAVLSRWERFPGSMGIADLRDAISTVNSPDIAIPLAILKEYQKGGVNDGFFDRKKALLSTRLETGQWYNFDLSTLREANKKIVHVVTIGKQPMDIYIDEGWRLLRSGAFADLLDELGRRARKRGIGVSLVTHLPGDLAKNQTSLSMASTAFIGRMSPDEAKMFFRSLGVPESEAEMNAARVSLLPPRTFLAAPSGGRGALFPVTVTIPPVWLDFWKKLGATTFVRSEE